MKSLKELSLALLLAVPVVATKAQTNETATSPFSYAPTPQTQAFVRYGNNTVDMNTGSVSINIPVYTYKDNDFELPLSLTYTSQGFVPGQQTGILGLGWFLNCAGIISREIKGVPDDYVSSDGTKGVLLGKSSCSESDIMELKEKHPNSNGWQHYVVDGRETTSDIYHFSFNGHSGTFHFDTSKQLHVYNTGGNHGTYTIIPILPANNTLHGFIIKTGDGYEYTFGSNDLSERINSVERSIGGRMSGDAVYTVNESSLTSNPIVTWNLTKIKAPNGRIVTFEYEDVYRNLGPFINSKSANNPFLVTTFTNGLSLYDDYGKDHFRSVSIVQTTYLSRILIDNGTEILFSMSLKDCCDRPVAPDIISSIEQDHCITQRLNKIDSIIVKNCNGKEVHHTKFTYKIKDNRLLLSNVHTDGIGDYHMSYHEEHSFPAISTADTDFWGYYNGKNNDYGTVSATQINDDYNDYICSEAKNPNWNYSRLGCLKRITYPTGGFSTFEYEANRADEILLKRSSPPIGGFQEPEVLPADTTSREERIAYLVDLYPYKTLFYDDDECGGVRLARTIDYDNYIGYQSRSYTYSGGIVYTFPKHNIANLYSLQIYNPFVEYPANSLDKQHICYSTVRETHSDGSYIISRFNDYHTHPDDYLGQVRKVNTSLDNIPYAYTPSYINNVLRSPNSNHAKRGKINTKEYYNSDDSLVKQSTYEYEMHDSAYTAYVVTSGKYFCSVKRYIGDYRLVAVEEKEYYDEGDITTKETYSYDDKGRVVCSTTALPCGNYMHTYTQYNDEIFLHLFNQPSIIEKVCEDENGMTLIDAIKYEYTYFLGMRLPKSISKVQLSENVAYPLNITSSPSTILQKNISYNTKGYPTEIVDNHGVHTSIVWGYGGMYPIIIAYGIDLATLNIQGNIQESLNEQQLSTLFDNTLCKINVYEYEPLVGVTRHYTDKHRYTLYEYDTYGRLIRVLDNEGKQLEYEYIQAKE